MRKLLLCALILACQITCFAGETKTDADRAGAVAVTFINSYIKASDAKNWNPVKWVSENQT